MKEKEIEILDEEPKKEEFQEIELNDQDEVRTDSYFDGKVLDYVGWLLLSYLISFLTFGIASPWGKCILYKYRFSHTIYNGKRLKFEGDGGELFVNRFKWFLLTIITLGIYGWWVPAKKINWVISNLHFEDEEYKKEESFFAEKGIKLFWLDIALKFLNIISVGLLMPFTMSIKLRYISRNTVINKKKIVFTGAGISLIGRYILWIILTCITFGIYGWCVPINIFKWQTENTHLKVNGEVEEKHNDKSVFLIIPIFIVGNIILIGLIILFLTTFSSFSIGGVFKYPIDEVINGWKYCEKGYVYKNSNTDEAYCYIKEDNMTFDECTAKGGELTYSEKCYQKHKPIKKAKNPSKLIKSNH